MSNNTIPEVATGVSNATLEMLDSPVMTVAVPIIYLVVFVCSTPFNLLSLVVLMSIHHKQQTATSVFAINLSLSDLLYSAFLPLQVLYHRGGNDWTWGATVCRVTTTALHCNMHCSALTTCAIALERYCGVVHPLRTKHWHTASRAAIVCVLIWTVVLFAQTPLLQSDLTLLISPLNITTCYDVIPRKLFPNSFLSYLYFAAILVLFYMLPLIVLVGSYIAVVRQLRRSAVARATEGEERHALSREWARTAVALATACFVVCYLPTLVLQVLHLVSTSLWNKSLYAYYKLALSINSFNCFFDPFVYYFASMKFRQTLWKALGRCCRWCAPPEEREYHGMSGKN